MIHHFFRMVLLVININECLDNKCQHESKCIDGIASYTCDCRNGYNGTFCEVDIDDCEPQPCRNGGKKQNTLKSSLECIFGYIPVF